MESKMSQAQALPNALAERYKVTEVRVVTLNGVRSLLYSAWVENPSGFAGGWVFAGQRSAKPRTPKRELLRRLAAEHPQK